MRIYSCKDCGNRHPGCHGHCETYKKEKAEHEEQKAVENQRKYVQQGLYNQRSVAIRKTARRDSWYDRYGHRGRK